MIQPTTEKEVQEAVQTHPRLLVQGAGSKPGLSTPPESVTSLSLGGLTGLVDYHPSEYTFTALAGTPVQEMIELLATKGQHLPFDPLLVKRGATLGGVVATGSSGAGRYGYGSVRDFLIGISFVDGQGRLVRGGGKVVKNAAGFDLPKLMVGSLGQLGALTELTFKVFPKPESSATLQLQCTGLATALDVTMHLTRAPFDIHALDFNPAGFVWIRLSGLSKALPERLNHLKSTIAALNNSGIQHMDILDGEADQTRWQQAQEFDWVPEGWGVVKVPLSPKRVLVLEERLDGRGMERRYSIGGNVAWVACPPDDESLQTSPFNTIDAVLTRIDLSGMVLLGPPGRTLVGLQTGLPLLRRVKQALDPQHRFLEV
ncbi:MAG: FAD-binding protein [Chloroflexota bacterium]